MAAHDQQLVPHAVVDGAVLVEVLDPMGKALPLSLGSIRVEIRVCEIRAVEETEVPRCLILSA